MGSDVKKRLEWPPEHISAKVFVEITEEAVGMADGTIPLERSFVWPVNNHIPTDDIVVKDLFSLLKDVEYEYDDINSRRGATFQTLAYVGRLVGMDARQRCGWYDICESVGLSQRHASHMIESLEYARKEKSEAGNKGKPLVAVDELTRRRARYNASKTG